MNTENPGKLESWILASRPKTLPAAIAPVLVGIAFVINHNKFDLLISLITVITAVLLQILANLSNDYYDYLKGYDNEDRIGPMRVTASGLISLKELQIGLIINILLSMLFGLYLVIVGGIIILLIGILSIIFAILYSGGPFPLSSNGLGDIFVFIFFGVIAVNGTYYLQVLEFHIDVVFGSIPVGLLIVAILVVNNYRDIETDSRTSKHTLAVLLGETLTRYYYAVLLVVSYLIPIFLIIWLDFKLFILLPIVTIPLAYKLIKIIFSTKDGSILNEALAGTAKLSLLYSILFSIGVILS